MTSLSEVFPHFNENNGNVLLPRIDTTPVPEVPGEVQDTDDGPIIMCGKLLWVVGVLKKTILLRPKNNGTCKKG